MLTIFWSADKTISGYYRVDLSEEKNLTNVFPSAIIK